MRFALVIVAYNCAADLPALADSLSGALRDEDEAVVVDNASSDGTAARARELGLRVIEAGSNLGFGGGCRLGASATTAPLLFFLNPDARLESGALDVLGAVAEARPDWGAWQPAVMLPDGRINSAGGVAHYLGLGWAGKCGQPASTLPDTPYEAAFASGAALVIRRDVWEELGGFDDSYFLYGEDLELGLRLWLAGRGVGVEPRARVVHDYEFEKGNGKWFLLERNRWRTLIALYPAPLLALFAPALAMTEAALLLVSARDGWLTAKLRADLSVLFGLRRALRRRATLRPSRRLDAAAFAAVLDSSLDSPYIGGLPRTLVAAQAAYLKAARLLLRVRSGAPVSIARSAGGQGSGRGEAP